MAIAARLRYEVLKRDGHRCYYCHTTELPLTVDHVIPQALGGTDDPANLVAACSPCNSGKASTNPADNQVAEADWRALVWSAAITVLAEDRLREHQKFAEICDGFYAEWQSWTSGGEFNKKAVPLDADWRHSIKRWIGAGLTIHDLIDLVDVAMASRVRPADTWKYFCGCAWKLVKKVREQAYQVADQAEQLRQLEDGPA